MMCTTFLYPEEYALPERTKATPTAAQATRTSLKKISRENQCFNSNFTSSRQFTGPQQLAGSFGYSGQQLGYVNYIVFDKL